MAFTRSSTASFAPSLPVQVSDGGRLADLEITEVRNTVAEAVCIDRLNEPGARDLEELLGGLGLLPDGDDD